MAYVRQVHRQTVRNRTVLASTIWDRIEFGAKLGWWPAVAGFIFALRSGDLGFFVIGVLATIALTVTMAVEADEEDLWAIRQADPPEQKIVQTAESIRRWAE